MRVRQNIRPSLGKMTNLQFGVGFVKKLRKYIICPFLGLALTTSLVMAELKIGFVNVPQVMSEAPQAEQARKDMEREFSPRKNRLVASGKEIRKLEERLNRDAAVMSDSERKRLETDIIKKRREAKRSEDELREDLNIRRNEILGKLQKQVFEAIRSLAKEGGYDLLLTDGVVYASDAVDVTTRVQEKLKSRYP